MDASLQDLKFQIKLKQNCQAIKKKQLDIKLCKYSNAQKLPHQNNNWYPIRKSYDDFWKGHVNIIISNRANEYDPST